MDSSRLENMSVLQKDRLNYKPPLPHDLKGPHFKLVEATGLHSLSSTALQKHFPNTADQVLVKVASCEQQATRARPDTPLRIGVVFCGRQTPGGHNVIYGLYDYLKEHHPAGKLIGIVNGTLGLFKGEHIEITEEIISLYRNQGGYDMLGRSVDSIKGEEQLLATYHTCQKLHLNGLVLIGGPITMTYAGYLAEFFASKQKSSGSSLTTKVIGVPGTIDGDLKNRFIESVFGFDTACKVYSELIGNIAIDGNSAQKYYYFIRLMGRAPSHITVECALQTNPNIVIVSEEVESEMKPLEQVVSEICDVICERANLKKNFGVVLLSEGLVKAVPEISLLVKELNEILEEAQKYGVSGENLHNFIVEKMSPWNSAIFKFLPLEFRNQLLLPRESGGSLQLSQIEMEKLLANLCEVELKKRKKEGTYKGAFSSICHFFGYQARSALPSVFDCNLAYIMGYASGVLTDNVDPASTGGIMVSIRNLVSPNVADWQVWGVPLTMMMVQERLEELPNNKGNQPVIPSAKVDLKGKTFALLKERRKNWEVSDIYANPGPIQYEGPSSTLTTVTLQAEERDLVEKLKSIEQYCETLKVACRSGVNEKILDAALAGLDSLTKIVEMMK